MRIAYLVHQDIRGRFGGSEVYARHLAEAAVRAGHRVFVIMRGDGHGALLQRVNEAGVDYIILDAAQLQPNRRRFVFRETFDNPQAFHLVRQVLTDLTPNHLHIHHFLMNSARLAFWAKAVGLTVTATLHDYWAFCHRITWQFPDQRDCPGAQGGRRCRNCGDPFYSHGPGRLLQPFHTAGFILRNRMLRRAYEVMDAVFVPSLAVWQAHLEHGFARTRLIRRPYGLPAWGKGSRPERRTPLAVGFIGRLVPEKGVDILLEAATLGRNFVLHVFGHGTPEYEAELCRRGGDRIRFHGSFAHENLPEVLDQVDLVALPSRWRENLPLAALEAARRGVPVVAAPNGGLAETAELCGALLVAENTPAAWAAALDNLAGDETAWRKLVEATGYSPNIEDDLAAHLAAGRPT